MEKEKTKPFEKWTRDDVADLGFVQKHHSPLLNNWLSADTHHLKENASLNELKNLLAENGQIWNEQELFCNFIIPIFKLLKINDLAYREFAGRLIELQLDAEKIKLKLDYLIGSGQFKPQNIYFCLHQNRYSQYAGNDQITQLLIRMIAIQKLNQFSIQPTLGCYIVERNWFFVTLSGKEFCVSRSFDATKADDILQILACLHFVKNDIIKRVEQK
jgi:hypothetical protein